MCRVHRGSAHPLQILPGHQQGAGAGAAGSLGPEEGHRPGGHRRLHPPGLAGGAEGEALPGGGGVLHPEGGHRRPPVCDHRGDQHHLQEGRQGAQGPLPDPPARSGGGGDPVPPAGGHRQPPLRRTAHPGPGLPGSAGDHPGVLPRRGVHPRPHLDAPLLPVRGLLRLRHHRGVLRGSHKPHPRPGDGAVLRPAHEPPLLRPGRVHPGVQLRRPLPLQAGAGGQPALLRPVLPGAFPGHPDRGGLLRHHRVLPRGGQVPLRRPPELLGMPLPGGGGGGRRSVPRVRKAAHHRRAPPGGTALRPPRGLCAGERQAL